MNLYLLFKSLHLIAAISWIAGLLYLPRIFVYHVENKEKKEATDIFEVMERRLFFYILLAILNKLCKNLEFSTLVGGGCLLYTSPSPRD